MSRTIGRSMGWIVLVGVLGAAVDVARAQGEAPSGDDQILTNSIGMQLRRIEPGSFLMGSDDGDKDEQPVHKVAITKPFYIGVYEVTQEQYEKVMGVNPSSFQGPNRPVEHVSWEDAKAFCRKLSEMENVEYRLPTEAEWEYACRAGTATKFFWGDRFDTRYFWCAYRSGTESHPVGRTQPNAWGLYDMSGNVWEWCEDWYAEDAYRHAPSRDPAGPKTGTRRVIRGGSWCGTPEDCRSANRMSYPPDRHMYTIGFRVCRTCP